MRFAIVLSLASCACACSQSAPATTGTSSASGAAATGGSSASAAGAASTTSAAASSASTASSSTAATASSSSGAATAASSSSGAATTGSGTSGGSTGGIATIATLGTGTTGMSSTSTSSSSTGTSTTGTTGTPLLRFAFTGDTRPDSCDDLANYPTPVMDSIISSMAAQNLAFALDTGDHLKICKSDSKSTAAAYADDQLAMYTQSTAALGRPFFLTMGNHECRDHSALCDTTDAVLSVFMNYVDQQISTAQPYYTFDVQAAHGVATFVFIADTAWDSTEAAWLDAALTHGDSSEYTIIAKHVPSSNTSDFPTNIDELAIIDAHRFALLVDSHAHEYLHAGESGREVTLGLGGAPLDDPSAQYGYGLVEEQPDGTLRVSYIAADTSATLDSFSVAPN